MITNCFHSLSPMGLNPECNIYIPKPIVWHMIGLHKNECEENVCWIKMKQLCNEIKITSVKTEGKLFHLIFMKVDKKQSSKKSVQVAAF